MSLQEYKITETQIAQKGVTAAPDKLTGTAAQNKAIFDRLIREALAGEYNSLIDALEQYGVEKTVRYVDGDGQIAYIRLNSDRVLETSTDGEEWEATGSSGHIIVAPDGTELPQRSRMKFVNGNVTDTGTETVITALKGDTGDTGPRGPQGLQGEKGDKGDIGSAWYPSVDSLGNLTFTLSDTETPPPSYNIRGPQGPQGVQGLQGATGSSGPQGIQGPQGVQGIQGEQGETGPRGATGAQGPAGPAGADGERGPRGYTGEAGKNFTIKDVYATLAALRAAFPTGNDNAYQVTAEDNEIFIFSETELDWISVGKLEGPQGPQGLRGIQGEIGPAGEKGETGEPGADGARGPTGPQGPIGPQGLKGDNGADGRDFKVLGLFAALAALQIAHPTGSGGDAYAVGSAANNTIYIWDTDDEEWTDIGALQGPQGPQGIQGVQGPQGIQGPQGDTGAQGATGDTGPSGVYVGDSEPTEDSVLIWLNTDGEADSYASESYVDAGDEALQEQIDAITSQSDVVDVVGTYEELQAYSKPIYEDDIVKVLSDSTHNDAISYYRAGADSPTYDWTYLGSQGPYYTKSEADNKFRTAEQVNTAIAVAIGNAIGGSY